MLKLGRHRGRKQYRQRAMNEPVGRSLWWKVGVSTRDGGS